MTTNSYITLKHTSGSSADTYGDGVKFKVVQGGYKPGMSKQINVQRAINGYADVTLGGIYGHFQYTLKIRGQGVPGYTDYGQLSELESFYELNTPSGSPGNIIELTDHFQQTHKVVMFGDFVPEPATTIIEGNCAVYFVPVQFEVLEPVA